MPNKVQPGDKLVTSPLNEAAFVNHLIDLVNHWQRGVLLNRPTQANTHGDDNNVILVRNDTGAVLAMGEAIKIGDYLLGTKQPTQRVFEALEIDTTFDTRIAIAAEPIPEDKIGRAYIAGMCPVKYTGTAPSSGDWMGPKPGAATLEKGYPGCIRVEDVTDSGTPKLLLGTLAPITTLAGKADSNIAAMSSDTPGSGTVSIWYFNGTSYADTTMNVTAYNKSKVEVTANEHITLLLVNGIWEVIFEACGGA